MNTKYLKSEKLSILLFVITFIMYSVVYMSKNMFSAAMASIVSEGIMTKSQTGAISSVFWLFYAPFQIVGGFAADRYAPHKLIVVGVVGAIISNLVIYLNQSYYVIMIAWSFNAIIQFGLWTGIFKIVSTRVNPEFRSGAVFWILFSTSVGIALSMLVASFVSHWLQNFIISTIALVVMLIIWLVVYKWLEGKMVADDKTEPHVKKSVVTQKASMKELIFKSGLICILVIVLFRSMVDNGIKSITHVMLMESYDNVPAAIATRMSTLLVVFCVFGTFLGKFIKSRITDNEVKANAILLSIGLPFLAVTCFVGKVHYLVILGALSFSIMFINGAAPFSNSYVATRFIPYGRGGTVAGITNGIAAVGIALATYVFPKIAETFPWNVVAIIWVMSIVVSILLSLAVMRVWARFIGEKK